MKITKHQVKSALQRIAPAWVTRQILTNRGSVMVLLAAAAIAIMQHFLTIRGSFEMSVFMSTVALPVGGALLMVIGFAHIGWFVDRTPAVAWYAAILGFIFAVLSFQYFRAITLLFGLIVAMFAVTTFAITLLRELRRQPPS